MIRGTDTTVFHCLSTNEVLSIKKFGTFN